MVQKMAGPNGRSANSLAEEVGVSQSSLSRWLKRAGTVSSMVKKKTAGQRRTGSSRSTTPAKSWRPQDKLEIVLEAASLSEEELGEFLRRKGLHEAQIDEWREQLTNAAPLVFANPCRRKKASPETKRIAELEKELHRKEKALAETAALLVLKKKADAIWGVVDDDTDGSKDR